MSPSALTLALRRRQLDAALQPADVIRRTPDHVLIECYTDCPHCRGSLFADPDAAVRDASDADAFVDACNMAIANHHCPASATS